ncbi:DUF5005 domain-containing protein [candidate division KSB1 bacterium]
MKYLSVFLLFLYLNCGTSDIPNFKVNIDENYNALFTRTSGWTGGDVAHSIPLSDSLTLWVFGDSWVGPVVDGRHYNAAMINNSLAIQKGKDPVPENIKFYHKEKDGKPASFLNPQITLDFSG